MQQDLHQTMQNIDNRQFVNDNLSIRDIMETSIASLRKVCDDLEKIKQKMASSETESIIPPMLNLMQMFGLTAVDSGK